MCKPFCHLHNHSHYSLLDGLASTKDLVSAAHDLGYQSLALTDHGTCAGLLQFQRDCLDKGIKPILGMEGYITDDHKAKHKETRSYHIVVLAKNEVGLKNLMNLSSLAFIDGFYRRPRFDWDLLVKFKEGLIVTSACCIGEISTYIWEGNIEKAEEVAARYKDAFGDDFYIEIMMHKYFDNKQQEERERKLSNDLYKLAKRMGIKAICTNDTHYARKRDWEYHDVLLAMQTHDHIKNKKRKLSFNSDEFYLKPYEEMEKMYGKVPSLLQNTLEIAEKVDNKPLLFEKEDLLPEFSLPEGYSDGATYLKALVKQGMVAHGFINKKSYRERIKYEMSVILKCKYERYFLILWDLINYCNRNGIRIGIGRGSGASSLCLYCLGVTKLDPIKHDLIFERFLNPERISPPDVDLDFDDSRRQEVFSYLINQYGAEHCAKIGTYNAFGPKNCIQYAVKALDLGKDWENTQLQLQQNPDKKPIESKNSIELALRLSKMIPEKPGLTLEEVIRTVPDFKQACLQYPKLLDCAMNIEGTLVSAGVHAAGMVVCKDPLTDHIPLRQKNKVVCSQFDKNEVEDLGLLKFDILGLKTLAVLENTVQLIKERTGKYIDVDKLEPTDKKVLDVFSGKYRNITTKGIFQFESPGMTELLRNIRADAFIDLVTANALYRPGPMGSGMHDEYCNYKHGRKEIQTVHPKMKDILKKTYGIMVFQEDTMRIAQELAGFTFGEADILRKAMGKKKPELLKEQREKFVSGCVKKGTDEKVANEVFDQIFKFAEYGFNVSHAASYALLAYQCCFLKYYYPIEFMASLLSSELERTEKLNLYMKDADLMGIKIFKADINKSGMHFKVVKNESGEDVLLSPLTALKGVGAKAVETIVENQPFNSLEDFLSSVDLRKVNKKVFEVLLNAGCMDGAWGMTRREIQAQYEITKKRIDKKKKAKKKEEDRMSLYGGSLFDNDDVEIRV